MESFLSSAAEKLDFEGDIQRIKDVLNTKSEGAWKDGTGPERMERGVSEYVERVSNDLDIPLSEEEREDLEDLFKDIGRNIKDLFSIPYSVTRGGNYQILNGNNYVKLLSFLDNARDRDKDELKKYRSLEGGSSASDSAHQDKYQLWWFGNPFFEIYGWLNLHREDVFLYNGKVRIDRFIERFEKVEGFEDLFGRYEDEYPEFYEDFYQSSYLTESDDHLEGLPDELSNEEKKTALRHIEIDQFFQYLYEELPNYWKVSPGRRAEHWDEFRSEGVTAIGWLEDVDLSDVDSKSELEQLLKNHDQYAEGKRKNQIWRFLKGIEKGDYILANKGQSNIVGVGVVTGDYDYNPSLSYPHSRKVDWRWTGDEEIKRQSSWTRTVEKPLDFDTLESIRSSTRDADYFILSTGSEEYEDRPKEIYHFKEGIPGSRQLREAERVKFVYYEDGDFYAFGEVESIEEEERNGTKHFNAKIKSYNKLPEVVPLEDIESKISVDFPTGYGVVKIDEEDFESIVGVGEKEVVPSEKSLGEFLLGDLVEEERPEIYREALAHLVAGKNIVFYGSPGSGKTRAARRLSEEVCDGYRLETANSEWTHYKVVGGLKPDKAGSWTSKPGFLVKSAHACSRSINKNSKPFWLIIDELNRANLDEAFGEVFTLLDLDYREETPIELEGEKTQVPLSFRILSTMNTYDKSQLFSLGYAFMRRFAFVEIPSLLRMLKEPELNEEEMEGERSELKEKVSERKNIVINAVKEHFIGEEYSSNDTSLVFPVLKKNVDAEKIDDLMNSSDLMIGELDFLDVLLLFSQKATEEEVVEIGQALVMDAAKFVLAYSLLFPEKAGTHVIDKTIVSYILPQFDFYMPTLRKKRTLGESGAGRKLKEIEEIAKRLGLPKTAAKLGKAEEEKRMIG